MTDYQLDLAELVDTTGSTAGLGTVILDDVFGRTGVPEESNPPLRFTEALNGIDAIEFVLPTDHADVTWGAGNNFDSGARELHLYRDGEMVFGGYLWGHRIESRQAIRFYGLGWASRLRKREITEKHLFLPDDPDPGIDHPFVYVEDEADQANIPYILISYTQDKAYGNLGIWRTGTNASNATGVRRKVAYCSWEHRKILPTIDDLAGAMNGFDWEISPLKEFLVHYPTKGSVLSVTLDADTNIPDVSWQEDAYEDTVSKFYGLGPCGTCDGTTRIKSDSSTPALERFGLLEDSDRWEIKDEDHLQDLTDEQLRVRKVPRFQPNMTVFSALPGAPDWTEYGVGDWLPVTSASKPALAFNKVCRILSKTTEVFANGFEVASVTLDTDGDDL